MTQQTIDEKAPATMQQAIDYLTSKGFSCKARVTFYKLIKKHHIPYKDYNEGGKYEARRFKWADLHQFVRDMGGEP